MRKEDLTCDVARALIAEQCPQWAHLPIVDVPVNGWDNSSFRLGDDKLVRLPSHERYVLGVHKEHRWLPWLAPQLPLAIPTPLYLGHPGTEFPRSWSVYGWIDGEPLSTGRIDDHVQLATDVADFLRVLYSLDGSDGPPAGKQNFMRGLPLTVFDEQTREAIETQRDTLDVPAVTALWEEACSTAWAGDPVWFHGDVAPNNLLVRDGRLCAFIDFGTSGVGDPACDVVLGYTFLSGAARAAYRERLALDDDTWTRGRGWALWKALITADLRVVAEVLSG
jgi:aminoglycoside phosphotransferase (APT) family kinase protein